MNTAPLNRKTCMSSRVLLRWLVVIVSALLLSVAATPDERTQAQAATCPVNLPQYITRAYRACRDMERNTVCYGNGDLTIGINPAYDDPRTVFANSGDRLPIEALVYLRAGATPLTADTWGITTMQVQANLLEEQPARSSSLWLFGDGQIENLVPPIPLVTGSATGTVNLRTLPQPDADIIEQLTLRQSLIANGRTADNRWLRVFVPRTQTLAWASLEVLTVNGDLNALEIVTPETPFYRPFQIITLQTGTQDSPCANVPDSGLLIQTPNDFDEVVFIVNGVTLRLKATVLLQAPPDAPLIVNVLNGWAEIDSGGVTERVPAGARSLVSGAAAPSPAEPYTPDDFDALPLAELPFQFTIPAPLTPAEILVALNPPETPTPVAPDPDLNPRCVRTLNQPATLRGGPGSFYEAVGDLAKDARIIAVYESTDADGYVWWQVRTGGWLRADFVASAGDCDAVPVTTALTAPPSYNRLVLERCESENGPIRSGQQLEITFVDGGWESYGEARDALKVGPATITIGNTRLHVTSSDPFLVASDPERWYRRFTAAWTARPGTYIIEGNRRYLSLRCNITVPFGR